MNSFRRCGRSFSSNEESSSTGAAETMRSFRLGLFLARATDADVSTGVYDGHSCPSQLMLVLMLFLPLQLLLNSPLHPNNPSTSQPKSTAADKSVRPTHE